MADDKLPPGMGMMTIPPNMFMVAEQPWYESSLVKMVAGAVLSLVILFAGRYGITPSPVMVPGETKVVTIGNDPWTGVSTYKVDGRLVTDK